MVGDGICNDEANHIECNYDGGDCCGSCVVKQYCSDCQCLGGDNTGNGVSSPSIGDGFCHDGNNIAACNYDGGDCCGNCVNTEHCSECICYHEVSGNGIPNGLMGTNRTTYRDDSPPLGCYDTTRKIVLQLKMIEWGIYGLGDGAAGMFLANHYSTLGSYFGNKFGHDWPHSPLLKKPSLLELSFHQKMMQITEILTNGKVKNVSILDFPAFGSMIGQINSNYKIKSNWPTEMNFEVFKGLDGNTQEMFTQYKNLLNDWKSYLIKVRLKDTQAHFSPIMKNNNILNFTKYIRDDVKSFLISIQASHLNPTKDSSPIWKEIAKVSLSNILKRTSTSILLLKSKPIY